MKEYLRTIHQRSETHKKHFALVVAALVTLTIFTIWLATTLNNNSTVVADSTDNTGNLAAVTAGTPDLGPVSLDSNTITPFQDIVAGIKSSFQALQSTVSNTTNGQ